MAANIRDLPSLLKNLIQTTADDSPTDPNQILNSFQAAPDTAGLNDTILFKNINHSGTYVYNNTTSMWNLAQYS